MQATNNIQKMKKANKAAYGEEISTKGRKLNKTQRGQKHVWQEVE